jgi:urease accessory protein UreH
MTAVVDRREPRRIGRDARLELVFALRAGRTVLTHSYAEPPFRAGRCFSEADGLHMILASSAPGIFGGDTMSQTIVVECGARVRLTSQSAAQVHPTAGGEGAHVRSIYRVADRARLHCHWDPLIPFGGAVLDQEIGIELSGAAELLWSDAFMTGRCGRGERWEFASLAHELEVIRNGTIEYLERYRLVPGDRTGEQSWVTGDAEYFGTAIASGARIDPADAERLHRELAAVIGVHGAADRLDEALLVVRLMSASGSAFHEARSLIRRRMSDRAT